MPGFPKPAPVDAGHGKISQHQVERLLTRLDECQRGLAVLGFLDLKVFRLERAADKPAHHRLVVDHEHSATVPNQSVGSSSCDHAALGTSLVTQL